MLVPITIASSFLMEGLDSTVIATCLPQIASAFGVHITVISSAITTYLVSIAVFIPLSGYLADRFEIKRVYCAAIAVFAAGSVLCGLSTGPTALVLGRFTQGVGGALMTPVGRLILVRSFPKGQLIQAMSFMIIPGLLGPMLGPVVGGFIATYADWRWIFFINVPLAAVAISLALSFIDRFESFPPGPFDFRGFILAGATLACVQSALGLLSVESISMKVALLFTAAAAAGLLYARHALGRKGAVIDLTMFTRRVFRIAILGGALARIGVAVPAFLVPILLQVAFGYSAFHAGALMFALAAGQIAVRFSIVAIYRRWNLRNVLLVNALLHVLALAGFASFTAGMSDTVMVGYLFGLGILQSILLSTLGALCFSDIPTDASSQATTISAVSQRFSLAVGISLSAFTLQIARPDGHFTAHDFIAPFIAMAALQSLCLLVFRALHQADGADIAARR